MIKKVHSFTIQEMVVVMIISAIVISIAMVVLNLLQKQIYNIELGFKNSTEIRLFEKALLNDFQLHEMEYLPEKNTLLGTSEINNVEYRFFENYVIRNLDTLGIKVLDKKIFLDNVSVNSGSLDAIDINFGLKSIFIFKQKDALFYMN